MMRQNAYGTNMKGVFLESLLDAHARWRERADELSDTLKLGILMGHYMSSRHRGRFYGKAQNLNRLLTAAYGRCALEGRCSPDAHDAHGDPSRFRVPAPAGKRSSTARSA